tara:strand:- start:214 stop:321 length:108 start_codon:yes stop_codon:yes gene_type:complete
MLLESVKSVFGAGWHEAAFFRAEKRANAPTVEVNR